MRALWVTGHNIGVRDNGGMTRIKLDRLGLHSLGQEAFEIRIDRLVVLRHRVERWLHPPRCLRHLRAEHFLGDKAFRPHTTLWHAPGQRLARSPGRRLFTQLRIAICRLHKPRLAGGVGNCAVRSHLIGQALANRRHYDRLVHGRGSAAPQPDPCRPGRRPRDQEAIASVSARALWRHGPTTCRGLFPLR
jgi:hypothetical protein